MKNERATTTCHKINQVHKHNIEQKKLNTKQSLVYDIIYMKYQKETRQNQTMVHRDRHIGDETVRESKEVMSLKIRTMVGSV